MWSELIGVMINMWLKLEPSGICDVPTWLACPRKWIVDHGSPLLALPFASLVDISSSYSQWWATLGNRQNVTLRLTVKKIPFEKVYSSVSNFTEKPWRNLTTIPYFSFSLHKWRAVIYFSNYVCVREFFHPTWFLDEDLVRVIWSVKEVIISSIIFPFWSTLILPADRWNSISAINAKYSFMSTL